MYYQYLNGLLRGNHGANDKDGVIGHDSQEHKGGFDNVICCQR